MSNTELVVFSHLRWTFVWQRPQQLISRLAADRKVFFVEEMTRGDVDAPVLRHEQAGPVTRVWMEVPFGEPGEPVGFDLAGQSGYGEAVAELVGPSEGRVAWLYTPLALDMARAVEPALLVYDVMDDLASFKGASPQLVLRQRQTLAGADIVFTGGRSLHRTVTRHRTPGVHLFPSGVETQHYATARQRQPRTGSRPVAGYVGVVDERLDLVLVADLAAALPDWEIRMVGPVAKIDPSSLPQAPNLSWLGSRRYEELPEVMAGFDVALMPFALNDATRSISPTKTLEYLAAGLPVISTRVPDVVADCSELVDLCDDGPAFAEGCARVLGHDRLERYGRAARLLHDRSWDTIAARMNGLIGAGLERFSSPARASGR
ncbi:MAG TPA: glycosyltransferase [Egibacteraceae bacterium]|nr:glycosyltransferase [Egibacteraceae bacterium]